MTRYVRDAAIDEGMRLAQRVFEKRGNKSKVHVGREELAALLAVAYEAGARGGSTASSDDAKGGGE